MFVYKYVNTVPKLKLDKRKYKLDPSVPDFENVTEVTDFIEVILFGEWAWGQGRTMRTTGTSGSWELSNSGSGITKMPS